MLAIELISVLLSTLFLEEAFADFKVIAINFIHTDPEFITYELSSIMAHPILPTISIVLHMLQPFPENSSFDVEMIEQFPGDIMIHLVNYSIPICDLTSRNRIMLPSYIREITEIGRCGIPGMFMRIDGGLFHYNLPRAVRNIQYPIVNANEIVSGFRTILKYDVILVNDKFNEGNILDPYEHKSK